jgi:hypothetical protein
LDLIFSGPTYGQVTLTNNIIDMQAVWSQGGSNVTATSITAPSGGSSTMTISNNPVPTLAIGTSIALAAYGANRMVITAFGTGSGGAGIYAVSNTNTGSFSGTGHGDTGVCTNPTIFSGNLGPSGKVSPTIMNEWGSVLVPGC